MKVIFLILNILLFIKILTDENQKYCNLEINCKSCIYCGSINNDYCSCNFYNIYCLDESSNTSKFSKNFLTNFDGCITNNGYMENICGQSNINLENGETKTINFKSTNTVNFLCYYNFKNIDSNNKQMGIAIRKKGNQTPDFNLYYIIYNNNNMNNTVVTSTNSILNDRDYYEFILYNADKISLYLDIKNPKYLDEISLSFFFEDRKKDNIPTTTPSTNVFRKSSSSSNTGLIIGIIIGGIALIGGIITATILFNKNKNKIKRKPSVNNSVVNIDNSNINNYTEYNNIVNKNKEKMDNLFKTELLPKKYNKYNSNNDYSNCTICMEDFIDNQSNVITSKCGHTFHQKCFKNWVYKNIICPKCPNCNYLILGPESNISIGNISMPSTINNYNYQSGGNTTLGLGN